jgi:hypothetical protein
VGLPQVSERPSRPSAKGAAESFNMRSEIGPLVLGFQSAVFAGYGIRELAFAYRTPKLQEWGERVVPAAGSVILGGLFADMALQRPNQASATRRSLAAHAQIFIPTR